MATFNFVPVVPYAVGDTSNEVVYANTLGAATTPILVGKSKILRVATSSSAACYIRFGANATVGPATAYDIYFPGGTVNLIDTGNNDSITVFGTAGYAIINVVSRN